MYNHKERAVFFASVHTYGRDVKIILDDFNAKVGR